MIDNKPRAKTVLEELRGEGDNNPVMVTQVSPPLVASTQERGEPHRSGRVVRQPECFIGLREISDDPETDPYNYNEVIQDKDATLWQKTMKAEMESMESM